MKDKKKGAIPSDPMENSEEFTTGSFTPQAQPSGNQEKESRSSCVDIQYPFTAEGKPACLSKACPKNDTCKVCCKDWRKT